MTQQEKVKAVSKILKAKFTNLTVEDTIDLSYKILDSIEGEKNEGNNKQSVN
jgi:hypothetical protein